MCGIFGVISRGQRCLSNNQRKVLVDTLFDLSASRGSDSSGLAVARGGHIEVLKKPVAPRLLKKSTEYQNVLSQDFEQIIGHTRMETNGSCDFEYNNQPVVKDGVISIHNGIIVNCDSLWQQFPTTTRKYQVDTEIFNSLLRYFIGQNVSVIEATKKAFRLVEGSVSIATLFDDCNYLLLATNTGSLYKVVSLDDSTLVFASERYILEKALEKLPAGFFDKTAITQIKPQTGYLVNLDTLNSAFIDFLDTKEAEVVNLPVSSVVPVCVSSGDISSLVTEYYEKNLEKIKKLRRCTKCILPETMPFIEFDEAGVCNYCRSYISQKLKEESSLEKLLSLYRGNCARPDCIVAFSGGRDSSFGLHYVKQVLGMNPVAFSYDWGMLTDLGRRNQARMCGKLGVEHVLVSADIRKKRENIKKNVEAWLRKPDLGTIPLFMAGDKQYFYFASKLKEQLGTNLLIMGENPYEKTVFKNGFAGIKQTTSGHMAYHVSIYGKLKMLFYYFNQFIKNPAYLNTSVVDSIGAYLSYFAIPHNYVNIYDYIQWDEAEVSNTLVDTYNWEKATDTETTWRIGDGTSPFYNYIYYTLAGFTESDTFRSNQIREGVLSRAEALTLCEKENTPRLEAIAWYCNTVGLDVTKVTRVIKSASKLY